MPKEVEVWYAVAVTLFCDSSTVIEFHQAVDHVDAASKHSAFEGDDDFVASWPDDYLELQGLMIECDQILEVERVLDMLIKSEG